MWGDHYNFVYYFFTYVLQPEKSRSNYFVVNDNLC